MKKRHKQSGVSIFVRPAEEKSIPQRLIDLSETIDDKEEMHKLFSRSERLWPKPLILSIIHRHVKTTTTKANPKFGDKD